MECSEPGLIRDEELLAYLAGERVRPVVEQHLARCPRCSTRLADYRRQELTLISKLYRWDCPPNQVLGEFHLGLLDPETSLAVKFHLRTCVPCSLELSTLGEFLSNDPLLVTQPAPLFAPEQTRTNNHHALPPAPGAFIERLLDHAGAVKRQIIAVLLPPAPRLSYQRAVASSAALWPRRYVADDFSISLQVERASGRADTFQLIGFVTRKDMSLEALQGMPVLLSSQAEQVSAQNVDELGNFVFSSLVPATYTLELQSPDSIIVIEQLTVEAQA